MREFAAVLSDRTKLHPADDSRTRTNRYGLAWWPGAAGDAAQAVEMFEEMLVDPDASQWERLHYRLAAAHWAGSAIGPDEAARNFHDVAEDIARSPHATSYIARDARRETLTWSLKADLGAAGRMISQGVHPDDFAPLLLAEILDGSAVRRRCCRPSAR